MKVTEIKLTLALQVEFHTVYCCNMSYRIVPTLAKLTNRRNMEGLKYLLEILETS